MRSGSGSTAGPFTPSDSGDKFIGRVTPERALIYTQNRKAGGPTQVVVGVRPTTKGFVTPAFWGALVSALLLGLGAIGQGTIGVLDTIKDNSAESAVALLVVVPSLVATYLVGSNEHEVRSILLMVPRYFVAATSTFSIAAAIALTAQFSGHTLAIFWGICGGVCAAILIFIATICWRIEFKRQATVKQSANQDRAAIKKW